MAALRSKNLAVTAQINDQVIEMSPRETVLQAALRNGIDFPFSCGVGGCGSCKCRVTEGKVRELTETGYLLSAQELDDGYILACQSVPQSDLRIEVDLARHAVRRKHLGRVVAQTKLTHDITRLQVQLDQPLSYDAGQFAQLSIDALPGVVRSYSFATAASPDGRVSFLVRKVPAGQFSSLINDQDLIGNRVEVDGPAGDFWLRPSDAPMLLVAGGSGLAPILAMLEQALAAGVSRSVTLLFGAREQRDLYALEDLAVIAQQWHGAFRFIPVLSEASADSTWNGARGLVTEHLIGVIEPGTHAYLCGPPAMIDSAVAVLTQQGVSADRVHCDRFVTQHDPIAAIPASASPRNTTSVGNALHYLKYFSFSLVGLCALLAVLAGGTLPTLGLLAILTFYIVGDAIAGDDTSTPRLQYPGILTAQLWLALPLLSIIVFSSVWSISASDILGFGAALTRWSGYDVIAARDASSWGDHVSTGILTGLMIGMVGTITAHELTHRTWDPISMSIGRWLLAFSFDTTFAIEHVYGHHRYVSTSQDPATAPRGRNVYFHVLASTVRGNRSAWHIETERLQKKRLARYSWHNAVIRGHVMSVALVAIAYVVGGWQAAVFFTICALWGKSLLEIVNYMEHYGIVRNPRTPVQPRHSWNTNRRISSWTMFNLTRHSHHHAQGEVPFQDLRPYPSAPMMINGYLTTLLVAMVPPLWHALMSPKVLAWDREFANQEERALAAHANAVSGIARLQRSVQVGEGSMVHGGTSASTAIAVRVAG
jgi:NAD(P)H-flavin reductase/ferredoxin